MSSVAETPPPQKKPADDGKSVIDMSKMNEGQRAALQVTEAARESHDDISFVAGMFMGRWKPEKLYPLTDIDPEEKPRADKFLADLATFLREKVDAYDRRRSETQPYKSQRFVEKFGEDPFYGWSEDKARQYSVPERHAFGRYVRGQGFGLV